MLSFLLQIIVHTPLWVWPLMLFVLWLGWWGLQPRTLPPARLAILPLVGVGTSLAAVAQSMKPGLALAGWAVALIAALPLGGRVKLNAWDNKVEMIKAQPVAITSARDKMPFEVTPFFPRLSRFGANAPNANPSPTTTASSASN